jgi:hypothetical protein
MSVVKVMIKGLAFCRPVPAQPGTPGIPAMTQVLFPHPPNHKLKLSITRKRQDGREFDSVSDELYDQNFMFMSLTPDADFTQPPPLSDGKPLSKDLIDLVALHKRDDPQSFFRFKVRKNVRIPVSFLSIPTDQIFAGGYSENEYEIWAHRQNLGVKPPIRERSFLGNPDKRFLAVAVTTAFEVTAPHDGNIPQVLLQLRPFLSDPPSDPMEPFTRSYSLAHALDPQDKTKELDYTLLFDNHCHSETCGADFGFYYEMLDVEDQYNNSVEIEELPLDRLPPGERDSEASCNPVTGDTPCDLQHWHGFQGCQ